MSKFVYVTYIHTTAEKLWAALTTPEFTKQYWFGATLETDWKAGSPWQMKFADGRIADAGEVLESDPPRRFVLKWQHQLNPDLKAEGFSRCVFEIEEKDGVSKLSINHEIDVAEPSKFIAAVSGGWPKILSNLKSLLETGKTIGIS